MGRRVVMAFGAMLGLASWGQWIEAAVGRTPGSFAVTPSGSASYTIPIFAPPGVNGLTPSVALVYNSGGGVGYVGRGWSLAGFSAITRCEKTVAQDGTAGPVQLQASDVYCLNGNRLRLATGTYGQTGSTYRTEIADFSLITAQGVSGNGPASFSVKAKSGLYYFYGETTDSRVKASGQETAHTWHLNEIRDRSGNKILFTYKTPNATTTGTTHPTKIQWVATSSEASTYVYSMDFLYQANVPASSLYGYIAGTEVRDTDLLEAIQVSVGGSLKRNYKIGYDTSPTTGAKRLTSVKECSDAAVQDCLAPTVVAYQDGVIGADTSSTALSVSGALTGFNVRHDFNGDGLADIAYRKAGTWYVRFASPTGYSGEVSTGITTTILTAGDLYGNRQHYILALVGANWHVYGWNGSSFAATSLGLNTSAMPDGAALSDADGDGRADLVYGSAVGSTTYNVAVRRNTSTSSLSFAAPVTSTITASWDVPAPPGYSPYYISGAYVIGADQAYGALSRGRYDVNGDGREDIRTAVMFVLCAYNPGDGSMDCSQSGSNTQFLIAQGNLQYTLGSMPTLAGMATDFNADGCRDFVSGTTVSIAGCNGSTAATATLSAPVKGTVDWNGDGRSDILTLPSGSSTLKVQLSLGNDVASALETNIPAGAVCTAFATDANGDGLDEVGCWNYNQGVSLYYHNGPMITPDLATSFSDGFGVNATVDYSALTSSVYTPNSNAVYPQQDVRRTIEGLGGLQVVSAATTTDGVNGTYTTSYTYHGATQDVQGRGFEAFEKIQATDNRNGMSRVDQYERKFPKTGHLKQVEIFQQGGTLVSRQIITVDTLAAGPGQFAYASATSGLQNEVGGAADGQRIVDTSSTMSYDSYGNLTAVSSTVTDRDPNSPNHNYSWTQSQTTTISPNTDNWCVGLPTAVSVTYTATNGEASVTRSQSMAPDYAMCRLNAQTVEPGSSTRRVDTSFGYDGFGNLYSVAVTGRTSAGATMAERTSYTNWGSANGTMPGTGQFPVQATNAVGHVTTRTYNGVTGQLATETDPSGVVQVTHAFDSFQRLQRSTRADSTSTVYTYAYCGGSYPCENGDKASGVTGINKLVVVASERTTADAEVRKDITYFDQFDRPIVQKGHNLSGGYSRIGRQYDNLGRIHRETVPCDDSACSQFWITNDYDLMNRVITQTRPETQSLPTPVTTTFAYNRMTHTVTDPQSKVSKKILDVAGRMRRSEDHAGYYQSFGYDAFGSLKSVGDSLGNALYSANYSYGIHAFQDSTTDMDLGAWSYFYNSLGERTSWTDAKSQSFTQTWDPASRPLVRTDPDQETTWNWGTSGIKVGRLSSLSSANPSYTENYSYDAFGRHSNTAFTYSSIEHNFSYSYNDAGLLSEIKYPTSTASTRVAVAYNYQYGKLKSVQDNTGGVSGTVYWQANSQNARGQVTGDQLGNGIVRSRAFDAVTGWQANVQAGVGSGSGVLNQSYLYDLVGNVKQRQDSNAGLTENFYYDNLYRLDYSQLNGVTNLDVTYDAMGNITARSDVGGGAAWTYHATKKHAVTSAGGVSYGYDANGNMTSRGGATITWTSFNYASALPVPGGTATFTYGPRRNYFLSTMPHPDGGPLETTLHIGDRMERSTRGGDVDWRHYVKVNGETVAIISRKSSGTNVVNYVLSDHQGSPAVLANSAGGTLLKESYAAFGGQRDASTWSGSQSSGDQITMANLSRRGYTDHLMAGFGGLIHMNGRVQDSVTGRFLSPDPYTSEPHHTQGYNRYAYVRNNPLSYTDPSGFFILDSLIANLEWMCGLFYNCPATSLPEELVTAARYRDAERELAEYHRRQQEGQHHAGQSGQSETGGGGGGEQSPAPPKEKQSRPCTWKEDDGNWSLEFGGYLQGRGFEFEFGSVHGISFVKLRIGMGYGGGISYDRAPDLPGVYPQNAYQSGWIFSYSARAEANLGPLGVSGEAGFARNFQNSPQTAPFVDGSNPLEFERRGLKAGGSAGAELTRYWGRGRSLEIGETCQL